MRAYEVLAADVFNGYDGYTSLGVVRASSPGAAANKALGALADDPFDSEGSPVLTPDPAIVVVPLRYMVPLGGLRVPRAIVDAFVAGEPS